MPEPIHRLNAWFRHLFTSAAAWFRGDDPAAEPQEHEAASSVGGSAADAFASQPWQASAQANGFTTPPPDRQSPLLRPHDVTGQAFTAADITPQLTSLNPQSSAPFTPRPLAAHISRPLTSRLDPPLDARPGYPATFMPPTSPLPGPANLSALQSPQSPQTSPSPPSPYQATGPNDDTLPPRTPSLPGLPEAQLFPGAADLPPLGDLDAPTLPGVNSQLRAEPAETPPDVQPPQFAATGAQDGAADYAPFPLPQGDYGADGDDADADDDESDQPTDKLAVDDALARALSGRDDTPGAFDAPDGSPVTRRRMFFLRYLVRRRVYNEGFAPGEAPPQYHHSLGLDDDGADDTLPGM